MKTDIGVNVPTMLLPKKGVDLQKWAVVACDQYTSQREYWHEVESFVGDNPSTLHMIYPEVYLEDEDNAARIKTIHAAIKKYLAEKILAEETPGFIYLDRSTEHSKSRKGLMIALDLEKYDFNKGSQTLIRATEGTVIERLPPRIRIRKGADIESPHILILIDDPKQTVIEPLAKKADKLKKIYDFDLMMNSGHIKGYKIDDAQTIADVTNALEKLADPIEFQKKYNVGKDKGVLLFAVGDGNHSLATAKSIWEELKKDPNIDSNHPARFALVEMVNVHDAGIIFEPIHRVIFNVEHKDLLKQMEEFYKKNGNEFSCVVCKDRKSAFNELEKMPKDKTHSMVYVSGNEYGVVTVKKPKSNLEVGTLQTFIDDFLKSNKNAKIDYIHGDDVVENLSKKGNSMGFYLPAMEKTDLFKTVVLDGALPRKTFSMGEASEKRFYLECRKITK